MKYVVTGGAGFIGSGLVRALIDQPDARVEVVDDFSTGRAVNVEEVKDRIVLHESDIRDYDAMRRVFDGADVVFHLAAIPSVPRSIQDPVPSHDVNMNGMFQVFRACADRKVKRVVYASSSSAYGDTPVLPKVESMPPNPKSPYAAQKLMGEYYASSFHTCYGLDAVSLRYFNVYGPRQDPSSPYSGVISIFMRCVLEGLSPTIYGDGNHSRDFTYVEDVAELCIKAARAQGVGGRVINAGNGNRYTLNDLWHTLNRIAGTSIAANYGPERAGDVRDSMADTGLAANLLGHSPRFSLEEGLRRTIEWYRSNR